MKPQLNFKAIGMISTIVLLVFTTSSMQSLNAQTAAASVVVTESKPELQVKFIGSTGDFLFFELTMQQSDDTRSNLRIRNEDGNELYSESVFQKTTIRKLKIAKDEAEKIEFVYSNPRGETRKTIAIKIKLQEAIEVKDITKL
jgi:hypothetical protein